MHSKTYFLTLFSTLAAILAQDPSGTGTQPSPSALPQDVVNLYLPPDSHVQSTSDEGGSWGGYGYEGPWAFGFGTNGYEQEAFVLELYEQGTFAQPTGGMLAGHDVGIIPGDPTKVITVSFAAYFVRVHVCVGLGRQLG
jgi:hypothetical protein